jgi:predicted XRE-type DNA-binding protein
MSTIGAGVREIRLRSGDGAFRVIYVANLGDAIYALLPEEVAAHQQGRHCSGDPSLQAIGRGTKMTKKRFDSIWDAIESPAVAENMKLRAKLMGAIIKHMEREELSQAAAAKLMGVTQPRVSDLVRGKIDLFSIDTLINLASAAGLQVDLKVARAA